MELINLSDMSLVLYSLAVCRRCINTKIPALKPKLCLSNTGLTMYNLLIYSIVLWNNVKVCMINVVVIRTD